MVAIMVAAVPFVNKQSWLIGSAVALSAVSFIDDVRGLSILLRLAAHVTAAGLIALHLPLTLPGMMLTAVSITAATNFYNFMDGANGLAGGVATIGFSAMGVAAAIQGDMELSLIASVIAAASFGFLIFNFGNAKVFLGDTGSISLGFFAGALGITGWSQGVWSLTFPALAFAPFLLDSGVTLIKRAHSGCLIWQSHREHYYQRLVLMGWSHRRVSLTYYGLTVVGCGLGLLSIDKQESVHWIGYSVFLISMLLLMRETDKLWDTKT